MTDYGRPIHFGYLLSPDATDPGGTLRTARLVDDLGLDLIGVTDHPDQPHLLETWTLLAAIAASTQRVRVLPNVANLALRPPAMLAKAAASLDLLSGGRVELGLGAGGFFYGHASHAMGGRTFPQGQAVAALEDAIHVIRTAWSPQPSASYHGEHYQFQGVRPGPVPAHPIGLWIGAFRPRMLALTGRIGDGWIPSFGYGIADPPQLPTLHARIDQAAVATGRDPAAITRAYNAMGARITDRELGGTFNGPVDHWVDSLTTLVLEQGMDTVVFGGSPEEAQLRRFALEVVPQVREQVARERAVSPGQRR